MLHFDLSPDDFKRARAFAVQFFYQQDMLSSTGRVSQAWKEELVFFCTHSMVPVSFVPFLQALCQWNEDNHKKSNQLIEKYATNWKLSRMARMDVAVLRVLIAELLCRLHIDHDILLAESARLAYEFGSEHSSSFVNGILAAIVSKIKDDSPHLAL